MNADAVPSITPSRTVVTSFTPHKPSLSSVGNSTAVREGNANGNGNGDWVLCAAASSNSGNNTKSHAQEETVSCALSNGQIQVYDQERLHRINSFQQQSSSIVNDLIYGPQHCLVTAANNGQVTVWDLRQAGGAVLQSSIPAGQEALSVSVGFDGYLAAVASNKSRIHFMDLRQAGSNSSNNVMGSYVDAHTMEVTQVRFQPYSTILLSAAEDGLACVFDTTQPTEDAALKSVWNVGSAVRRAGFCGPDLSVVYCLTGSETASIWHWDSATCRQDFGGHALRYRLAQSIPQHKSQSMAIDYLVDAHWDCVNHELLLMAGSATGDAALFRLGSNHADFEPCRLLKSGHGGIVRTWCPLSSSSSGKLITAGEDARLCEWNLATDAATNDISCTLEPLHTPTLSAPDRLAATGRSVAPMTGEENSLRPPKRPKQSRPPPY